MGYTGFTLNSAHPPNIHLSVDNVSEIKKKKTIGSIHFIPGSYHYGVSLLTPVHLHVPKSISSVRWPNIRPKLEFPELFEKAIGSLHFMPGIYPYGVSFLAPILFRVPSIHFSPQLAECLAENGISRIKINYWQNLFDTLHLPSWGQSLDSYSFLCSYHQFWSPGGTKYWPKMGFPQFVGKK